jgi:hypothetical protein
MVALLQLQLMSVTLQGDAAMAVKRQVRYGGMKRQ